MEKDVSTRLRKLAKGAGRLRASGPVRSYVLDPTARCVDHATGETADPFKVLEGDLDNLLRARMAAAGEEPKPHDWRIAQLD